MMADLGAILGPLMAGLIIDAADFDWAFGVGAILCIIAIGFVIRMPETLRRSQPQVDASDSPT